HQNPKRHAPPTTNLAQHRRQPYWELKGVGDKSQSLSFVTDPFYTQCSWPALLLVIVEFNLPDQRQTRVASVRKWDSGFIQDCSIITLPTVPPERVRNPQQWLQPQISIYSELASRPYTRKQS
ncbi:MAG: hypothetical protein WBM52_09535, partial [Thiogranum sp.]